MNEVTLFRHFGTKEHLIEAVVGSAFGGKGAGKEGPADRVRGLRGHLEQFARRYEDLLVANLPLVRTMIGEIHRHAVCEHQALRGIFWPMREALVERLKAALVTGEMRAGINPAIAADLFAGTIFSAVIRRSKPGMRRSYSSSAYRQACVDVFLGGIGRR